MSDRSGGGDRGAPIRASARARRDAGLSLVELLIATVLGIMLVGGTATIFHGNLRSAELGRSIAAMQSNARFALDELTRDLHAAGYRGCASIDGTPYTVGAPGAPLADAEPDASAVTGARIGGSGWTPSLPVGYTPPTGRAEPVVGTDALLIQYARHPGEAIRDTMDDAGDTIAIDGLVSGLDVGDLAVVADCGGADLFAVGTRVGAGDDVLLQPSRSLSRAYRLDLRFAFGEPRVMPFVSAIYYVGDTDRVTESGDAVRSLYRQTFPYDIESNPPLELVEGVDQLQLAFGMRSGANGLRYVRADDVAYVPEEVTSVRVGLLMASLERHDENATDRVFSLAGRRVVASGTTGAVGAARYPADERLRRSFERSVTVRNRALGRLAP